MYIAIYVSAIVLLCAGAIAVYVLYDNKNKKLAKRLKQKAEEEHPVALPQDSGEKQSQDLTISEDSKDAQGQLEDFSLELEKEKPKKKEQSFDLNPFSLDEGFTGKNETENDDDLDKKFKEYEDFLKRNLDLDDDDLNDVEIPGAFEDFDESEDFGEYVPKTTNHASGEDLRALQNFDYDSLKGKSEEEIEDIIKNLPQKAQEILLSDILARRKLDDDDQ